MRRHNERGQSIVEFVVTLPVFLLILSGVIFLGQYYMWWQRSMMASRYSAWKYSRTVGSDDEKRAAAASEETKKLYFGDYRALTTYRFADGASIDDDGKSGIPPIISNIVRKLTDTKGCEVQFQYKPPAGLVAFGKAREIKGRHWVTTDNWPRRRTGAWPHFIKEGF